ncbi:MAG: SGNH/GDSL hydrolase family protein [Phycisphaerales bacterium]|nr:SGNH/GDSL hydrolase family protein [Phycisphaerales bacterium]
MRCESWLAILIVLALGMGSPAMAEENEDKNEVIKNWLFTEGTKGWNGVASDETKEVKIMEGRDGVDGIRLVRKKQGAAVAISQTVELKKQTLYYFEVVGRATTGNLMVRLRPQSSTEKAFENLYKCWAASSAPMPIKEGEWVISTMWFDSGLKVDRVVVSVYLQGEEPGEYVVEKVRLREMGTSVLPEGGKVKVMLHLGDSLTSSIDLPFAKRVESVIARTERAHRATLNLRQFNYSANGETIRELLDSGRYQKVVKENLAKVDVVVIRYGANDMRSETPEAFRKSLEELCDRLEKDYPGVKIILGTGPFLLNQDDVNKKYSPYWQVSRDVAKDRKYPLADVYAAFESKRSETLCRGKADMHPSAEGVKLMGQVIWEQLREVIRGELDVKSTTR